MSEKYIFAGEDSKLKVFDRVSFSLLQTLKGHTDTIESVAVNDKHIFTGSADKDIRIWSYDDWSTQKILDSHTGGIKALLAHQNMLISGSTDKTIRIWDTEQEEEEETVLHGHSKHVKCLAISSDGQLLFSGSNDNSIKIWDMKGKCCLFNFDGHTGWITSISLIGKYLFSASNDKTIRVWDAQSLTCVKAFPKYHSETINTIVATHHGAFSGSDDSAIQVLDFSKMEPNSLPKEHKGSVVSMVYHQGQLLSSSFDGVKIWKYEE